MNDRISRLRPAIIVAALAFAQIVGGGALIDAGYGGTGIALFFTGIVSVGVTLPFFAYFVVENHD